MTKKLEAVAGSLEQKLFTIKNAARKWVKNMDPANENRGCYVMAVYEDSVVVEIYEDGNSRYLQIDYTAEETDTTMTVAFSNPRAVAVQTVVIALPDGAAPTPESGEVTVVKEAAGGSPPNGLHLEQLPWNGPDILEHEVNGEFQIWSRPKLEAVKDSGGIRKVRGRVPLMIAGATTKSKTNYSVECCRHMFSDIKAFLESGADSFEEGPWPVGAMYVSHGDRLTMQAGFNNLAGIAAQFTGVYVEGGKAIDQLKEGDIIGVTFETLSTAKGRDLVALLTESRFIKGISLAGFKQDGKVESDGIDYVSRMKVEQGFGADFCDRPNTPYRSPSQAAPKLESNVLGGKEGKRMDLEKLKTESPDLYAEIMAGRQATKDLEAEKKATRSAKVEGAADAVVALLEKKVDAGLTETMKGTLMESVRATVKTEAEKIADQRKELDPGTSEFRDAVLSAANPAFEAEKTRFDKIKAEALKSAMKSAGLPDGTTAEGDPNLDGKGKAKMEAPMINTMPFPALLLESRNEQVGLPRGRKNPDGSLIGCRMTDVIEAKVLGRPVYMEHPKLGGPAHVLDVHQPGLRDSIMEMSRVYSTRPGLDGKIERGVPFLTDSRGMGITDDQLFRGEKKAALEHFNAVCRGEVKFEANETTSSDLGTLHPDIRQGVLEFLFAVSAFANIATLVPCKSSAYKVFYRDYRRREELTFGTFAQGGAFSASAVTVNYAWRAFVKVTTLTAGAVVFTVTYTDENGTTGNTCTVTVPTGSTVGTYIQIYPQTGHRIANITGVTSDAGWSAGAVSFIAEGNANDGSETGVSIRAKSTLESITGTVEELDIDTELTWTAIEDANMSLANVGPGSVDIAAQTVRDIVNDLLNLVDIRGLGSLNNTANFLSINTLSFNSASPGTGYSAGTDWNKQLLDYIAQTSARIHGSSHLVPDWMLVNLGDKHKLTWIAELIQFAGGGARLEALVNGMNWGTIDNMRTIVSENQNHGRFMMGSRGNVFYPVYVPMQIRGPLYTGQKADQYIIRQRSAPGVFARPESRGYLAVS